MLTPDDYGCIGLIAIFITVSNTLVDGGFGSALIQKKDVTIEDYSTIYWWNLLVAIILYVLLVLSAPVISTFYRTPTLTPLLRVLGIVLIFNSLNIVPTYRLRKKLDFKKIAQISLISSTFASCVAIIMAYKGFGVWSLVIQQVLATFISTILFVFYSKWMPKFIFSINGFLYMFNFGGYILVSNVINTFCNNVQGLLIGRYFSPSIMGYYTQARKLEEIASHSFSNVIEQVSYPILSKFQDDNMAMQSVLKKLISVLTYIMFPLMSIIILLAEPIVLILYGEKWLPSVPYLKILCIAGIAICIQGIYYYAVASKGKSKDLFLWTIIKRVLGLLAIVIGMKIWSINGLLWGCVLSSWFIVFTNMYLVNKHINYSILSQLKVIFPSLILSIISYIVVYNIGELYTADLFLTTLISLFSYIFVYILLSIMFRIKALDLFKEVVRTFKK